MLLVQKSDASIRPLFPNPAVTYCMCNAILQLTSIIMHVCIKQICMFSLHGTITSWGSDLFTSSDAPYTETSILTCFSACKFLFYKRARKAFVSLLC